MEIKNEQERDIYYCEMCGRVLDEDMKCWFDPYHRAGYYYDKLVLVIRRELKIDKLIDFITYVMHK